MFAFWSLAAQGATARSRCKVLVLGCPLRFVAVRVLLSECCVLPQGSACRSAARVKKTHLSAAQEYLLHPFAFWGLCWRNFKHLNLCTKHGYDASKVVYKPSRAHLEVK